MNTKDIRVVTLLAALACSQVALATDVSIVRTPLGSGTPGEVGVEQAPPVMDGMYHAPQYMPGFPTAATIWPRVVDVDCAKESTTLKCDSYNWAPKLGRGEYLYIRPHVTEKPVPAVPIVIYKEVPVKKGKE